MAMMLRLPIIKGFSSSLSCPWRTHAAARGRGLRGLLRRFGFLSSASSVVRDYHRRKQQNRDALNRIDSLVTLLKLMDAGADGGSGF